MSDSPNRPLRVFLCHASGNKSEVRKLYSRLIDDGVDAWFDKEKLIPGQNWQIEIPKAVRFSDIVLVCLSTQSINKEGFVQKEIRIALDAADEKPEGTIFIIPIRLEECSVPERISQFHWVDLFEKDGYEHLFKALQLRAHGLGIVINRETNALPSLSSAINEVSFPAYSSFQKDLERLIQEAENGFINIKRDETQSVLDGYINYDSKFTFEYSINNRIWKREEGGWYFTCTFCERTNLQQAEKVFNERVQEIKPLLINNWKFEEHDKSNSLYRKTFEAIRRYNTLKIKMELAAYNQGNNSQVNFTLEQLNP